MSTEKDSNIIGGLSPNRRILILDEHAAIEDDIRTFLGEHARTHTLDTSIDRDPGDTTLGSPARSSYQIDSVYSAPEALEAIQKRIAQGQPYAITFVDMPLRPSGERIETIEQIAKEDHEIHVVMCTITTAYSWHEILDNLDDTDRLLILKKPLENVEVSQLAHALIEKWNLRRQAQLKMDELANMVEERTAELQHINEMLRDEIRQRREAEEQLRHDALHDVLTNLPNRVLLLDRIERCIERSKRAKDYLFAVLFLDLDDFKVINDSLGHSVGDALLVEIANRLISSLRALDSVSRPMVKTMARIGGDEFVVLLDGIRKASDASLVANRVQKTIARPMELEGREVVTAVSIGITTNQIGYDSPEDILRDADTALYRAKELGRGTHVVFDKDMRSQAMERLQIQGDVRKIIEREQLHIQYQPIVCLSTGRIDGLEALVRWNHPPRGLLSASEFVPIAEEVGIIIPIGEWILRQVCQQARQWRSKHTNYPNLSVCVNLSFRQFSADTMLDQIDQILSETEFDPRYLKLDVAEDTIMRDRSHTTKLLKELAARHLAVHLDDFGTGQSSLSCLYNLPVAAIKLDRSFVRQMSTHEDTGTIQTIVALAHSQKMKVIVEGVERAEQLKQLQFARCDLAQGYFFSEPVEAEVIDAILVSGGHWLKTV